MSDSMKLDDIDGGIISSPQKVSGDSVKFHLNPRDSPIWTPSRRTPSSTTRPSEQQLSSDIEVLWEGFSRYGGHQWGEHGQVWLPAQVVEVCVVDQMEETGQARGTIGGLHVRVCVRHSSQFLDEPDFWVPIKHVRLRTNVGSLFRPTFEPRNGDFVEVKEVLRGHVLWHVGRVQRIEDGGRAVVVHLNSGHLVVVGLMDIKVECLFEKSNFFPSN